MRGPSILRLAAALLALVALTIACERDPGAALLEADEPTPEPTLQPDDRVDLTVYFRDSARGHLTPVVREVEVSDDLPRRALELLLRGPTDEEVEAEGLEAPLPPTTQVLGFSTDGATALVDLSAHVIRDADDVDANPDNEVLALASLAGTLTEFPAIDQVQLSVEGVTSGWRGGVSVGGFWGGWGLPEILVRDETLLGPAPRDGEGLPELTLFTAEPQSVGSSNGDPVAVSTVRMRSRTTYLRLTIEVADPDDPDASGPTPTARARLDGSAVVVEIDDVTAYTAEVSAGQRLGLEDPAFDSLAVELTALPGTARLRLTLSEPRPFLLHRLSSPTRVVLDVKK